ncbi:succinate--hydroxymethylglutarate CoA-transferase [Scaptodrosophila lebanonensis]|uniref:Succinate--hydroxymethylglutarate CoA-transferase n=1 Tax=Drosophila lebanonensis TaxID=7225 RepID=A0A6J2T6V8_DROLE|nr:succinate--hydroxymethylglutarate CoA-transferase [Scaptodrosophila lebanonensis]XP_030371739.1 succinate--hydroxymethylglutarate CoA-transferase [Scaptodrosophila lebanonensis]
MLTRRLQHLAVRHSRTTLAIAVNNSSSSNRRSCSSQSDKNNNDSGDTNKTTDRHPLKGVRILDLTRIVAGPYCTMVLADLGAEVIKVERPHHGDEARHWGPPFLKHSKDSTYFLPVNRNKQSICIDLKRGQKLIYELAKRSDVLVENYVPGTLERYGLGYEHFREMTPQLIYCTLSGYGSAGPYAKRPGYDVIAASIGGLLHITGEHDGPPSKVGVAVTDIATGLYAHGAILAALYQRQRTQRGQKIEVNLLSTQISMLINVASNYLNAGSEAQRWGTAHSSIVPYQSFKTLDGYLTIGAGSDAQFVELCRLLEIEHISADPKFNTNTNRVQHRTELVGILTEILECHTSKYWMGLFNKAPFPVGPVNSIREVFEDDHVNAIGLVKSLPHAKSGEVKVVGPPVVYSEAQNDARTAPPMLGEHTDQVLANLLEYSPSEIADLRRQGIVQ